jgi:hypothetical protein
LAAFLGRAVSEEQGTAILGIVKAMAKSYCRADWDDDEIPDDVAAAIVTASARLVSHTRQVGIDETVGPQSARFYNAPVAWSVAELQVLNRYRVRAL